MPDRDLDGQHHFTVVGRMERELVMPHVAGVEMHVVQPADERVDPEEDLVQRLRPKNAPVNQLVHGVDGERGHGPVEKHRRRDRPPWPFLHRVQDDAGGERHQSEMPQGLCQAPEVTPRIQAGEFFPLDRGTVPPDHL